MNKIFTLFLLFISLRAFCQVGGVSISPNGSVPDPSAALDINFTNKGLLMPRLTQHQRDSISSPALGLEIYNTTDNCIEVFGFNNWQTVSCLCSGAPSTPESITGNNNPCTNAGNVTYSVGLVLGATTYTWTVPSGATIIAGQGTNSITVDFGTNAGNITVAANNSCGNSSASTLAVTMDSIPGTPGAIAGNPYPCANSTAQAYSISAVNGATSYTWSVPSGSIVTAGQGTASILVNFYSTPGSLAVTANNACGSSSANALPITMAITPSTPGTIIGDTTFNTGQSGMVYSITPVTEATSYTWTLPGFDTITSGQGTDSITVTFANANGNICVSANNCAGSSSPSCRTAVNSCYTPGTQTFTYTGAEQIFTVPCGVPSVTITVSGAQGGNGSGYSNGGNGGAVTGTISITPGTNLYVFVGGQSGWNGGGTGGGSSGNGGDESDVRMGGANTSNWIIVGGGGGGGSDNGGQGGSGGGGFACANGVGGAGGTSGDAGSGSSGTCTVGGAAGDPNGGWSGGGGGGGLTSGGQGTTNAYSNNGGTGQQGIGGNRGSNNSCGCCGSTDGCGGGGGYYGGGGTSDGQCAAGCGGGGSSWVSGAMTNVTFSAGVQSGNGQVVIAW